KDQEPIDLPPTLTIAHLRHTGTQCSGYSTRRGFAELAPQLDRMASRWRHASSNRSPLQAGMTPVGWSDGGDCYGRLQSKRLETLCSLAVRAMASPIRGAMVMQRMLRAARTSSVSAMESVTTSSLSLLAATRSAAPAESTPWVM